MTGWAENRLSRSNWLWMGCAADGLWLKMGLRMGWAELQMDGLSDGHEVGRG